MRRRAQVTADDCRRCIDAGLTCAQCAAQFGAMVETVRQTARRAGLTFPRAGRDRTPSFRTVYYSIPGLTEDENRRYNRIRPYVRSHEAALFAIKPASDFRARSA